MDAAEVLALLVRAALGATAALALIPLLRRPLRRAFGPSIAYGVWALLPAMTVAAAFSRPTALLDAPPALQALSGPMSTTGMSAVMPQSVLSIELLFVGLWAAGVLAFVALRVAEQWRWRRRLGPLRRVEGRIAVATSDASLPALVGWPRACVVLPDDFAQRFTASEQALVLAHERRHLTRGDLHAQFLLEALRALLWFHPLLPWASRALRHDQELACDADVLRAQPDDRTDYARALLRATAVPLPPLATAWGSTHPLKERLAMLQQTPLSPRVRRIGVAAIFALIIFASAVAWAALPRASGATGPVPEGKLRQTWTLELDDRRKIGPFLLVEEAGVPVEMRFKNNGEAWVLTSSATPLPQGRFEVRARLIRNGNVEAEPQLVLGKDGGSIQVGREIGVNADGSTFVPFEGFKATVHVEAGEGDVVAAQVPRYPAGLAKAGVEGTVLLRVAVGVDGAATTVNVETSSGHAALDEAAVASARAWRFTPSIVDGQPVAGEVIVPVEFRADGKPPAEG